MAQTSGVPWLPGSISPTGMIRRKSFRLPVKVCFGLAEAAGGTSPIYTSTMDPSWEWDIIGIYMEYSWDIYWLVLEKKPL